MTVTVGMLGYRFMGKAHSNALARLPMFFPEAPEIERDILVGRDEEALADAADRLEFARTTTDWQEAIDEVDVFYNLGPNHVHAEPTIAALEAGVPVLCEKPLAATTDDAERMAAAADDADVPAAIAFNYRYVPAIRYAKRLIDDGILGEIHHIRATYLQDWLVDPQSPWSWRNSKELGRQRCSRRLGCALDRPRAVPTRGPNRTRQWTPPHLRRRTSGAKRRQRWSRREEPRQRRDPGGYGR